MKADCIIFDVDGTLVDSFPGIIDSFIYAIKQNGLPPPKREEVSALIGHHLDDMFKMITGIEQQAIIEMLVKTYREYYPIHGLPGASLYPGTRKVLDGLLEKDKVLAIASNKPKSYGDILMKELGIESLFSSIQFNELDGLDLKFTKADLIRRAMDETNAEDPVMVGDSVIDIRAAKELGVKTIACAFNGNSSERLLAEGPDIVIKDISELTYILNFK
jgi:phosphoglycolate phosphatase